jgi:hypothetical protein
MFKSIIISSALLVASLFTYQEANAAWQRWDGAWVSNVCRAPSGAVWIYPSEAAAPVGTYCRIYSTGEPGIVTAN